MTGAGAPLTPRHDRFPALDGVRAIAVTAVVATHAAFWTGRYVRGPFSVLLARLDAGVALFFVLSGFLLVRPWLIAAREARPAPSTRVYLWHRALRILPLYWVTVLLARILLAQDDPPWRGSDWWRQGLLLQTYHAGWWPRAGLSQTWSLCVEVSFYAVLPGIGLAFLAWSRWLGWRPLHLLAGCALLAAVSVMWPYLTVGQDWAARGLASLWLPQYLAWFCCGMALAVVEVHDTSGRCSPRWSRGMAVVRAAPGSWLVCSAALLGIALTPAAGPLGLSTVAESTAAVVRTLLYAGFATCLVLPMVFSVGSLPFRALAHPVMRRFGEISYGVFLLHLLVLEAAMRVLGYRLFGGSFFLVFVLTLAGSLAAASLAFRLVETPAMQLRGRVRPARRAPRRARHAAVPESA